MVYAGFRDGAIGIFEAESLGYNAGLHLLPTYLLQYLGMCNLQQLLFESGEILFLVTNI